jgi:hypothetical protein
MLVQREKSSILISSTCINDIHDGLSLYPGRQTLTQSAKLAAPRNSSELQESNGVRSDDVSRKDALD